MHPPTPRPASARSTPKVPTDRSNKAFCEITGSTNMVSRSEQRSETALKKAEETIEKRTNNGSTVLRRRSIPSKYAGPNLEKRASQSSALQIKRKDRHPFLQPCEPSNDVSGTENLRATSKGNVPSFWGNTARTEQASRSLKLGGDAFKKPGFGSDKGSPSTVATKAKPQSKHRAPQDARVLHSASYWLEQVKMAEAIQKHAVAIGFFRLAVECEAEPLQTLREEFISYKRKYNLCSESIFQVMSCYGVAEERPESLLSQMSVNTYPGSDAGSHIPFDHNVVGSQSAAAYSMEEPCSPCASNNSGKLIASNTKHHPEEGVPTAWQPEQKSLDDNDNTLPNLDDALEEEASNLVQIQLQHVPDGLCNLGRIQTMDVDSITREVISYLMSSMDDCANAQGVKFEGNCHPQDRLTENLPRKNSLVINASEVQDGCEVFKEPVSNNFEVAIASEASDQTVSTGSMPSLDEWNTLPIEADACVSEKMAQELHNVPRHYKDYEGVAEGIQLNAEQGSTYTEVSHVQGDCLTDRQSPRVAKRIESSCLLSETNPVFQRKDETHANTASIHDPSGNENCSMVAVDVAQRMPESTAKDGWNVENIAVVKDQHVKDAHAHKRSGGDKDLDANKACESDKKNVSQATFKPEFQNCAEIRRKARRSAARACSEANGSNLGGVSCDTTLASVRTLRQVVLSPNCTPQSVTTPTQGSATGSRRGRKQVYAQDCAISYSDVNESSATPGSTAVRRSARLRSFSNVSTPCSS